MTKSFAGHPEGTTDDKKRNDKQNDKNFLASICKEYVTELTKRDKCLPKHFLDELIKKKQLEFHVTKTIPKQTIQFYVWWETLNPHLPGMKSLLETTEEALVVIYTQMSMIR